jgi:subtilisin family serine protease
MLLVGVLLMTALAPGFLKADDADAALPLLVGLHPGESAARLTPTLRFYGASVTSRIDPIHLLVVQPRPGSAAGLAAHLRHNPAVRYVSVDEALPAAVMGMPSDPLTKDQWSLTKVKAPDAWDLLPKGGNTIVAVLDTGIDFTHPDLAGVISPAACNSLAGRCPEPSEYTRSQDLNGHGTHVAGIIGAIVNNGLGVAGLAGDRVTLLPITVGTRGGYITNPSAYLEGIVYAVDNGAKVINMSFGGECGRQAYEAYRDAIAYADAHGVLIVTSAGNTGTCYLGRYPQTDPRVLTVAASDISDSAPPWTDRGTWVAVAAPGVSVLSTVPMKLGGYRTYSGTSQAAPHVAALAALLFQVPGATKSQVVTWIKATCDPMPINVQCGGRVNFERAVSLAMTGVDPGRPPVEIHTAAAPTITPVTSVPDGDE